MTPSRVTNLFKTKNSMVNSGYQGMISNSWNKTEGETISQKVMGKVKPDEPLKNKIDFAQKEITIHKFQNYHGINQKLQEKTRCHI